MLGEGAPGEVSSAGLPQENWSSGVPGNTEVHLQPEPRLCALAQADECLGGGHRQVLTAASLVIGPARLGCCPHYLRAVVGRLRSRLVN